MHLEVTGHVKSAFVPEKNNGKFHKGSNRIPSSNI